MRPRAATEENVIPLDTPAIAFNPNLLLRLSEEQHLEATEAAAKRVAVVEENAGPKICKSLAEAKLRNSALIKVHSELPPLACI